MSSSRRLYSLVAAAACAALASAPNGAHAVDGAKEIHQACVATGCFPGDTPGYPVLITAPGSYVLTSNLTLPDENTVAIRSEVPNVSIDLGGFAILGTTVCITGNPGSCAPLGAGRGILHFPDPPGPITVRNGTIDGVGSSGIVAESGAIIEGVTIRNCGSFGVAANYARIHGNFIDLNFRGLQCAFCLVERNVVSRSVEAGMFAGAHSLFLENIVAANGGYGLNGVVGAFAANRFSGNNGGDANPQVLSAGGEMGTNFCGTDTTCP